MDFLKNIRDHYYHLNISSKYDTHFCKAILYDEISGTSIRIWDLMICVPNFLFLVYLIWRFKMSRERVRLLNTYAILRSFYIFIYLCAAVSMLRCFISVIMNVNTFSGDLLDRISWVVVRFFLLSTEISVLVFGLFSGHLSVRQSLRRILTITLIVALVYSMCQGSFEIIIPDVSFYIKSKDYYLFGHGGMIFWCCTCFLSFLVYLIVVFLPWMPCSDRLLLPTRKTFYIYAAILAVINVVQAFGALLFYLNRIEGLCIVDATTYLYFTLFTPLVYLTFLSPFLTAGSNNPAASALVTTTAGVESSHNPNRPPSAPLTRPSNLFTSGLRGAVNFSYRPQIDDDFIDNEEDFTGSTCIIGGLNFDLDGPYAYNTSRHGYLVYSDGIPRDFSSFSIQTSTNDVSTGDTQNESKRSSNEGSRSKNGDESSKDLLLESHMLQEQQTNKLSSLNIENLKDSNA